MKVALPVAKGEVWQHFGRSPAFLVAEVDGDRVTYLQELANPRGHAHHEGLAASLGTLGVEVVLAGGMGQGMREHLEGAGLQVICGVAGPVEEVLRRFAAGQLEPGPAGDCGHGHHHHHHGEGHGHHH